MPPNVLRASNKGLLIEGRRTFDALHNRDLSITHSVKVVSVASFQDGEEVRATGGGRGIFVALQSADGYAGIRNGTGAFTGRLMGSRSGASQIIDGRFGKLIWQHNGVAVTRDRPGIDRVNNRASRLVATKNKGTVTQQLTAREATRSQSAFVRRLKGVGRVDWTIDGVNWFELNLSPGWQWLSITDVTVTNPKIMFRLATKGDEISVDMVLNEVGRFKTSPMEVLNRPVTRAADDISLDLQPLNATYPSIKGSILMSFKANQNVNVMTMLSLHKIKGKDDERITFNAGPVPNQFGVTLESGGAKYGVDPRRPYNPGFHTFAATFDPNTKRVGAVLDSSEVRVNQNSPITWPVALRYLWVGRHENGNHCNCYLTRFIFSRTVLTDTQLKAWEK